jgi:hypothetical protein
MKLNLPILERLADSVSILISGAGGGHDVLAGLPLYFALRDAGKSVYGAIPLDDDEAQRTQVMISPLMSLYWFFDAQKVIERNLLIDLLRDTRSAREAFARFFFWARENGQRRPRRSIPY